MKEWEEEINERCRRTSQRLALIDVICDIHLGIKFLRKLFDLIKKKKKEKKSSKLKTKDFGFLRKGVK